MFHHTLQHKKNRHHTSSTPRHSVCCHRHLQLDKSHFSVHSHYQPNAYPLRLVCGKGEGTYRWHHSCRIGHPQGYHLSIKKQLSPHIRNSNTASPTTDEVRIIGHTSTHHIIKDHISLGFEQAAKL